MKIFILSDFNPFTGNSASKNRWRGLIEGLNQQNTDLYLVITQGFESYDEFRRYKMYSKFNTISIYHTLFLFQNNIWARRIIGYLLPVLITAINKQRVKHLLKKIEPDIILVLPVLEVLRIYKNISSTISSGSKTMIELNEFSDIGFAHSTNKLQKKQVQQFINLLNNDILPSIDFFLIMTQKLMEYYKPFGNPIKAKFLHLPMTIDLSRFDGIVKQQSENYIAYCGSSSFAKDGIDILIKAFIKIADKFENVKLKIAAFMENDGTKMLELIQKSGVSHRISYVGVLSRDEIPVFLTNAALLALPRPNTKQAEGGFPTKLGEYLASGNPVCATRVGEIPDYLTDNLSAFLANPGDIDSFADALIRALQNKKLSAEVGRKGRIVAEQNFNMVTQTKSVYDFLVNNITLKSNDIR